MQQASAGTLPLMQKIITCRPGCRGLQLHELIVLQLLPLQDIGRITRAEVHCKQESGASWQLTCLCQALSPWCYTQPHARQHLEGQAWVGQLTALAVLLGL